MSTITVRHAIRKFLEHIEVELQYSPRTIRAYQTDLEGSDGGAPGFHDHLMKVLGVKEPALADVSLVEVRGYVAELHRWKMARRSIVRKLAAVKSFMRFAVAQEWITVNSARNVTTGKPEKRLPTFLSIDEAKSMMDLPDRSTPGGLRDAAILELLYSSGIRRAELCGLKLQDVNLDSCVIKVMGKGGKERVIPFGMHAADAIRAYLLRRDELLRKPTKMLFISSRGKDLEGSDIYKIVHQYMGGVTQKKKRSPHVLRHTFATHMLDAGAGLREVGEMLGHGSLSSTQTYTHVTVERLKKAYALAHPRSGQEPPATEDEAP